MEWIRRRVAAWTARYPGLAGAVVPLLGFEVVTYPVRYLTDGLDGVPLGLAISLHAARTLVVAILLWRPKLAERFAALLYANAVAHITILHRLAESDETTLYYAALLIGAAVLFVSHTSMRQGVAISLIAGMAIGVISYDADLGPATAVAQSFFAGLLFVGSPLAVVWFRHRLHDARVAAESRAETDALTGLLNRRGLLDRAPEIVLQARARGERVVVLAADLDHFKQVNDRFGHGVGDEVLIAAADALRRCFRSSDLVARIGGEEFVVVLAASEENGRMLADRMHRAVPVATEPHPVTVSVGMVSGRPSPAEDAEAWLLDRVDRADALLYEAKRAGRDRVLAA